MKEVAELSGVSKRLLHYYDEIDLLKPDNVNESGYRFYSQENIDHLQHILFYRELGMPLKEIKQMIESPDFDELEALYSHQRALEKKKRQLDWMLKTVQQTIDEVKGESQMTNKEKFVGFDFSHNPYEKEAIERWGEEAVHRSNKIWADMSKEEQQRIQEEINQIYHSLAEVRHLDPKSNQAQEAIKQWYDCLNNGKFGTSYTPEVFRSLGEMYVADERFTKNIDQFGEGLAQFMKEAMSVFAEKMESVSE